MATDFDAGIDRRLNLYEVLQVSPHACPEVIQAAYRALARTYHPDVNPGDEAARQMRQLNAAYSVLSDPARRLRYDALRGRPMRARRQSAPVTPIHVVDVGRGASRSALHAVKIESIADGRINGGPQLGRVVLAAVFVLLLIGILAFGVWLAAGILDDEPARAALPSVVGAATFGVLSVLH